ncbi:MAG: dihydrodipicolinate synthase family protein [Acidimicrobiales bacterium]
MPTLGGVLPALVTPLDDGRLDHRGLERLLDHILQAPVAGIAPAGSTGEGPLLPKDLRVELTGAVRKRLTDDHWLIPGVPAPNASAAVAEIDALAGAGANAVLVPPPWYYPLGSLEVVDYFAALADASVLPIVLYNIPAFTKVSIEPPAAAALAAHPNVAGTKDSSRDFDHLTETIDATAGAGEFSVLTGTDSALHAALGAGARGTIGASVNVVPTEVQRLYELALAGRHDESLALQRHVADVVGACGAAGFPVGWKAALELLGICGGGPAAPLRRPSAEALSALDAALRRLGVVTG